MSYSALPIVVESIYDVPGTWNCSPRDAKGQPGPYESALIGTPIADEKMPLEVLRTIHSSDPCMACGMHLLDVDGNEINLVTVDTPDQYGNPLVKVRGARQCMIRLCLKPLC